jgi:hypothetical protein
MERRTRIDYRQKKERKNPQKDEQKNDQRMYQEIDNTPGKHNPDNKLIYRYCTA